MARVGKLEAIDNQIKKKQEKLFELKEKSDALAKEIEDLLNQKREAQKEELLEAIDDSGRTYKGIIEFLQSAPKRKVNSENGARRGRPKKA